MNKKKYSREELHRLLDENMFGKEEVDGMYLILMNDLGDGNMSSDTKATGIDPLDAVYSVMKHVLDSLGRGGYAFVMNEVMRRLHPDYITLAEDPQVKDFINRKMDQHEQQQHEPKQEKPAQYKAPRSPKDFVNLPPQTPPR